MTGKRFRELRKEWGYSAREIAEHFGRSVSFVYKLERYGEREIPKRWAKELCEFLGIDWKEMEEEEARARAMAEWLEEEMEDLENFVPSDEAVRVLEELIEKKGEWYM